MLKMRQTAEARLRELLFRVGVFLKGIDGSLEIAGGIALWVVGPGSIARLVELLTQNEIAETGGAGLIALTMIDLVVIWLIGLEYRAVRLRIP